jgi:hypothetical protein
VDSGDVIAGRYRLEQPVGQGNMGGVWLTTDRTLHRQVALKQGSSMRREGVSGAKLMDPNVIAVFDVVENEAGQALVASTTLVPSDLILLDNWD